jgi:hypothetical protein
MKKILFISLAVLSITFSQAQGLKVGIKGGANLSDPSGLSFKNGFQYGYHGGIFVELMLSKKWGIQPEAMLSETNLRTASQFNQIYSGISLSSVSNIKLQYLNIPLFLNYRPIKIISFQVGPQFGILMNQTHSITTNAGNAFKNGDFSMVAGAQLNLLKFKIYGRYGVGLNNINDIDNKDKWKSKTLQLGLGMAL